MANKKHETEEHEEHIDERWLVSYADLMTLLFGLFVILFSIASEKQGDFNENLKSISRSTSKVADEKPVKPEEINFEEQMKQLSTQLQLAKESITEKQKTIDKNLDMIELLRQQITISESTHRKSQQEIELARKQIEIFEQETKQRKLTQASEIQKDKATINYIAENEKLNETIKRLNLKIETIEKTLAKVPDKQKIERTISSLQNNDMENKKNIEDKEKQILDLKQKNIANEEQLKKLKSELLDNENKNKDNKTYLFVLFKWSTEKHDLDLTVVDPQKRLFSFKKKSYPGASGLFSLDSRTGPGAEIWQANNPVVGRYTVIIKMYNNYGNLEPAQLSGSILSNKTSIAIADKTIDSKSGSQLEIIFDIDEKGFIKMQ